MAGVKSASLASIRILENNEWDNSAMVEGYTPPKAGDHPEPFMNSISPGYFETLGVPIVAGRDFTVQDTQATLHQKGRNGTDWWAPTKVIVNETFAKRYFAGRDPIGRHIGYGAEPGTKLDMEVIGVAKDTKYTNLRDDVQEQAFEPYLAGRYINGMTLYVRTSLDPEQLFSTLRQKVREK